ncbi:elongin-B [Galendromus occidentalis]|uniref:Elongin-B n=1 Tax=Galendromus occidentalis TaxID=34638 RepID=A0AAJ6VZE8_9ACAR|nr:elongin-B [Galendromus occidentalis]
MDVSVMIMRKKTTLFLEVSEDATIHGLKLMIQGILKCAPEEQRLYIGQTEVDNDQTLVALGISGSRTGPHCPAGFGLAIGPEALDIAPLSWPSESPDVMKGQEANVEMTCS